MSDLVRISLSIEKTLYERLEYLVEEKGYTNRSEFVRDLIRDRLVSREWDADEETLGTITVVYDHRLSKLSEKIVDLQHAQRHNIIVVTHIHLNDDLCAEVILTKGRGLVIKDLADNLRKQKGILHVVLSFSSLGNELL